MDARISSFNSQLKSSDYTNLYTNFSADQTQQYSQMKSATYWDSTPFATADGPGQITMTNTTDPSNVTGSYSNANATFSVVMTMAKTGSDYFIVTLTLTPVPNPTNAAPFVIKRIR